MKQSTLILAGAAALAAAVVLFRRTPLAPVTASMRAAELRAANFRVQLGRELADNPGFWV